MSWSQGTSILQGELRAGRGGRARTEKGSSQEHLPFLRRDRAPAWPKSSGPAAQVLPASKVWAPSGRGRGSGCACRRGRQGAAAASGRRRKSRGAGERGSGGPSRRRLQIRELRGADRGASEPRRRRRRRPSLSRRSHPRGNYHPFGLPGGGSGSGDSIPVPGAGRKGGGGCGGGGWRGATPAGSQQWCATLGRSPRPLRGRRGSGRETPPAPSSPEFARPASRAGAPQLASAQGGSAQSMVPAPGSLGSL